MLLETVFQMEQASVLKTVALEPVIDLTVPWHNYQLLQPISGEQIGISSFCLLNRLFNIMIHPPEIYEQAAATRKALAFL